MAWNGGKKVRDLRVHSLRFRGLGFGMQGSELGVWSFGAGFAGLDRRCMVKGLGAKVEIAVDAKNHEGPFDLRTSCIGNCNFQAYSGHER